MDFLKKKVSTMLNFARILEMCKVFRFLLYFYIIVILLVGNRTSKWNKALNIPKNTF